jgi:hypothetical protein
MVSITWGPELAEVYDATYAAGFTPPVLDPVAGLLAALARGGPRWNSRWVPDKWHLR